jgi:hypothetical protein
LTAARAQDDDGPVLLRLDRALRREAGAQELANEPLAGKGLGQEQEVVLPAAHDDERRDDPRLRRQEQRRARLPGCERLDVVRDHAVEVRGRVRPSHGDV